MSGVEVVHGVVETPAEARLGDLAETIGHEYERMVEAGKAMVTHAIAIGDALLEAKTLVAPGAWCEWLDRTMPNGRRNSACRNYMRLAALKEYVDPELPIRTNLQLVTGLEKRSSATPRLPAEVKEEALRLHATGEFTNAAIARMVGTTNDTIRAWADPEYAAEKARRSNARRKAKREAERPELVEAAHKNERAFRYGEPGRAAVGRAVRRLAQVQGKAATHEALRDLAAISTAWADRLEGPNVRSEAA